MNACDAVGVVLAGGRSRRMGRDKTSLPSPLDSGETLLEWAATRVSSVCDDWVVADAGRELLAGASSVPDGPGAGPVAGLLGAADAFPGRPLLALACDLPLVPAAYLHRLCRGKETWVVPVTAQGPEPLCALYRPQAVETLGRRVDEDKFSLRDLASENPALPVRRIDGQSLLNAWKAGGDLGIEADLFFANVNRPEDLRRLEELFSGFAPAALRQTLLATSIDKRIHFG